MFLDTITLVKTLPCPAEPGRIIVIGQPSQTLTDVIPYLATLPDVIVYNPATCTVTFRRQHGFMTLYTDKVYITKVKDVQEGLELFKALTDAINATWSHRAELVAVTTARSAPAFWISGGSYRRPIARNAVNLPAWHLPQRYYNKKGCSPNVRL